MKLLLVEDNTAVGRALSKALRARGHDVVLVNNCGDATATSGQFDVGLFDLTLPDGDGIELCEQLQRDGRVLRSLFCSGSVDELLLARARRTAPVVSKETNFAELCRALEEPAASS